MKINKLMAMFSLVLLVVWIEAVPVPQDEKLEPIVLDSAADTGKKLSCYFTLETEHLFKKDFVQLLLQFANIYQVDYSYSVDR